MALGTKKVHCYHSSREERKSRKNTYDTPKGPDSDHQSTNVMKNNPETGPYGELEKEGYLVLTFI